jgi:hypothetical protein
MMSNQNWDLLRICASRYLPDPLPADVSVNLTTKILQVTIEDLVQGKYLLVDAFKYKISLENIR